jgi:hypothetical protein
VVFLGLSCLLLDHEQLLLVLPLAAFASHLLTSLVLLLLQTDTLLHVVLNLLSQLLFLPSQLRKHRGLLFVVNSGSEFLDSYGFFEVDVSILLFLLFNKGTQVLF